MVNEKLLDWAWKQLCGGDAGRRLIVVGVAFHADEIGITQTTHEEVMIWASLDWDEYQDALAYLQDTGLLTVVPVGDGVYQFILSGDKEKVL